MRPFLALSLTFLALSACAPEEWEHKSGPYPVAASIHENRGGMFVELENGRTCRAQIPEISEPGGKGALDRCPEGYTWQIEREGNGFGRFLAALAVGVTDIFGTNRPSIGVGKVTITTPDGAVSVFKVNPLPQDSETKEAEIVLIEQRAAPRPTR
jgi:hypothetical protein